MYMSSPGCSPLGPEPVMPAMWKCPFTTFMLDQVCGGASATLGERIVFMRKGLLCEAGSKQVRIPRHLDLPAQNSLWRLPQLARDISVGSHGAVAGASTRSPMQK